MRLKKWKFAKKNKFLAPKIICAPQRTFKNYLFEILPIFEILNGNNVQMVMNIANFFVIFVQNDVLYILLEFESDRFFLQFWRRISELIYENYDENYSMKKFLVSTTLLKFTHCIKFIEWNLILWRFFWYRSLTYTAVFAKFFQELPEQSPILSLRTEIIYVMIRNFLKSQPSQANSKAWLQL